MTATGRPEPFFSRGYVGRATDAELAARLEDLEALDEATDAELAEQGWIESEQDAREAWFSDDDRIRESVGNYTSARDGMPTR